MATAARARARPSAATPGVVMVQWCARGFALALILALVLVLLSAALDPS
ncbi:MAG: hypothetical protein IT562_21770 [Alphaproteobacteria bacterium]|nr:hypothetical protein [Alphaproteobacteria bacterium]